MAGHPGRVQKSSVLNHFGNNMKKQCKTCSKRRDLKFYDTPRSLNCQMCQIAKKNGIKKERKEASQRTWILRCDKLTGEKVRSRNICESPRPHNCKKNWQWCHGISRSYKNTRHLEINGFCMCAGEHYYFTNHPLEWDRFLEYKWGKDYSYYKYLALDTDHKIDFKELYKQLTK